MKNRKHIFINGLMYHHYRFGFIKNVKVLICRLFGHQMNQKHDHNWCGRCGLAHEEIYHKQLQS